MINRNARKVFRKGRYEFDVKSDYSLLMLSSVSKMSSKLLAEEAIS
jgi:hypothetical protein